MNKTYTITEIYKMLEEFYDWLALAPCDRIYDLCYWHESTFVDEGPSHWNETFGEPTVAHLFQEFIESKNQVDNEDI